MNVVSAVCRPAGHKHIFGVVFSFLTRYFEAVFKIIQSWFGDIRCGTIYIRTWLCSVAQHFHQKALRLVHASYSSCLLVTYLYFLNHLFNLFSHRCLLLIAIAFYLLFCFYLQSSYTVNIHIKNLSNIEVEIIKVMYEHLILYLLP
jgi:hypothetical protein